MITKTVYPRDRCDWSMATGEVLNAGISDYIEGYANGNHFSIKPQENGFSRLTI